MASDAVNTQLVVVGSSAGGIEALQTLVSTLPPDFPAPLLIAQHLDPRRPSHLGEILERRTTLPVQTILDHETLAPGKIYVVPADKDVTISDSHLTLRTNIGPARPKPSINLLFSSAAQTYGEGLVAVILTGAGSDGSMGALEVKKAGGTVVIQNPATASYPSMPQSLAPTSVDFIANIEDMGRLLYDLLMGVASATQASETKVLRSFLAHVHDQSGLDFSNYKPATIVRRLKRRMVATNCDSLDDYLRYLEHQPEEYQRLISTFLIKVTEFFRDRELFDTLRADILPRLIDNARRRSNELRIWSAGCATGEEAYSVAMLVADALGDELDRFNVRIYATDLDPQAIAYARRGLYPAASLAGAPPDMVERYFTRVDGDSEVNKRIRGLVVFGQHDLGQRAPFPHIDLVLCRNVLIYFGSELQKRVLQLFAYSLRNGGILVLGKAETSSPLTDYFIPVNSVLRIYRRYGEQLLLPAGQPNAPSPVRSSQMPHGKPNVSRIPNRLAPNASRAHTATERLYETVLGLPIGVAIVDRRYDVQTINTTALTLLGIHRSAIGEDLLHLAEKVPQKPLRAVIDEGFRNLSPSEMETTLEVEGDNGEVRVIHVRTYPQLPDREDNETETVALVITDQTAERRESAAAAVAAATRAAEAEAEAPLTEQEAAQRQQDELQRLKEQVHRLSTINRDLREANDDLTRTNLDLRQSNEEYVVTTEELQAASEEVETLNEELQASNEELETLNEELQATVEELNTSNDDMEARSQELQRLAAHLEAQRRTSETERARLAAILVNMGDAVLVVDADGAPVQTNNAYKRMFGDEEGALAPEDEWGQPLPLEETPQRRTARGESFNMEFSLPGSHGSRRWFEANGQPLVIDDIREGGVVVIRDITDRSMRRLQNEFLAQAAHELRTPLTSAQAALQALAQRRDHATPQTIDRNISIALNQVRRLGALVSDLVDVARLQNSKLNLQLGSVDLAHVVNKAVEAMQLSVTQRIELTIADEPLMVYGDALRLEQVIDNLLTNAAKYAPKAARIEVTARRNGDNAEVAVRDEGPGIAEPEASQLFSRFFQASRADNSIQAGLGLGLYITRELMVAQGGEVSVTSSPGIGSTFTIRIPLLSEDAQNRRTNIAPAD